VNFRQQLQEAYESGYKSAMNENAIRKLAKAAAEYFDVPKITLGQELKDYLNSLDLLVPRSVATPKIQTKKQQKYLGTTKDFANPFFRRNRDERLLKKTLDRRRAAFDRARLQPLPDPRLEQ